MGRDLIRKGFSHEITPQRSATGFSFPTTLRNTGRYPLSLRLYFMVQSIRMDKVDYYSFISPYDWTVAPGLIVYIPQMKDNQIISWGKC